MRRLTKRRFFSNSEVSRQHAGLMTVSFLMIFLGLWGVSGFAERTIRFLIYFNPDLTSELLSSISGIFVFVGSMLLTVQAFLIVRHEKESVEEKQKLDEALLKSIADGIIATDEKGIIVFLNPQAEHILMCEENEWKRKNIFEFIGLYDEREKKISKSTHPLQKLFFLKEDAVPFLTKPKGFFYLKKEGSQKKIPVSLNISPVIIQGVLHGTVIALRDITKEKEIDEMKSGFISVAAHQLRTPLGSIRWNIELLMEEMGTSFPEAVKSIIQNIYETNKRAIGLVNDLLNISHIEEGRFDDRPEHVLLGPIIQSVIQEYISEIEKMEISVSFDVKKYILIDVIVDPRRFRDVIQNIIGNAIRYNVSRGSISIIIEDRKNEIIISVSDTGMGIPDNEKEKVFSRFFRGSRAILSVPDGSGLGLFIVRSYIERWGGRIWFESVENKGSTFYFSIPILK
ncbi:MAG: ATP-binding protein [Patescibacteria group bacterium]